MYFCMVVYSYVYAHLFAASVACPAAPHLPNTRRVGSLTTIGANVVYLCQQDDFAFVDGSREHVMTCSRAASWQPDPDDIPECTRETQPAAARARRGGGFALCPMTNTS